MSCSTCQKAVERGLTDAGVPAGAGASSQQHCPECGAFLTQTGHCVNGACGAGGLAHLDAEAFRFALREDPQGLHDLYLGVMQECSRRVNEARSQGLQAIEAFKTEHSYEPAITGLCSSSDPELDDAWNALLVEENAKLEPAQADLEAYKAAQVEHLVESFQPAGGHALPGDEHYRLRGTEYIFGLSGIGAELAAHGAKVHVTTEDGYQVATMGTSGTTRADALLTGILQLAVAAKRGGLARERLTPPGRDPDEWWREQHPAPPKPAPKPGPIDLLTQAGMISVDGMIPMQRGRLNKSLNRYFNYSDAGVMSRAEWLAAHQEKLRYRKMHTRRFSMREVACERPELATPKREYIVWYEGEDGREHGMEMPKIVYDVLQLPERPSTSELEDGSLAN